MDYNAAQEVEMPKMSINQVTEIVRTERDQKNASWGEIAQKLKKMGHVSNRTREAITEATVRYYYYYRTKGGSSGVKHDLVEQNTGPARKLELIESVINLKTNAEGKVELIRSILAGA